MVMIRRVMASPDPRHDSLADFEQRHARNDTMARASLSGQHTMAAIAEHFSVHYSTVSWLVKALGNSKNACCNARPEPFPFVTPFPCLRGWGGVAVAAMGRSYRHKQRVCSCASRRRFSVCWLHARRASGRARLRSRRPALGGRCRRLARSRNPGHAKRGSGLALTHRSLAGFLHGAPTRT